MKWSIVGVLAVAAAATLWAVLPINQWLENTIMSIQRLGHWGIGVYFLLYFCLAAVTFPTTPLNVGSGLLFDLWVALPVALLADALAAFATFLFSRHVGREWATRKLHAWPLSESLVATVEAQGFKFVLLARLNPFIPSSVKNFGFGLTSIRFWEYGLATVLGQAPIVCAYVYLGWAGGATLLEPDNSHGLSYTVVGLGIAASVAMLAAISWYGRRHLGVH